MMNQTNKSIAQVVDDSLPHLVGEIGRQISPSSSVLTAAQAFVRSTYEACSQDVVLARLYMTSSFAGLPNDDRSFVRKVAMALAPGSRLQDSTPVLSLLGTCGTDSRWNDRRQSQGHLGIPLIDSRFIDGIPMLAALLTELGVDLKAFDSPSGVQVRKLIGGVNGVFFVEDARTAIDTKGRRIIPAQDFVASNGVRTVFGMGGGYMNGVLAVAIFFCRTHIPRAIAERMATLIAQFKSLTLTQVMANRLYQA